MRVLRIAFILALVPAFSFAQRGGGHGGGGGAHMGGAGGGGFRGGSGGVSRGFSGGTAYRAPAGGVYRGGVVGGVSRGFGGVGINRGSIGGGYRPGYGFGNRVYAGFGYGYGLGYGWPYWGYGWGAPYGYWPDYYDSYYPYDSSSYYGSYGYGGYPGGGYPGGGYYDGSAYDYGSQTPPTVINQDFGPGYSPNPPSPGSGADTYYQRPDYYLIAFTDHTIQAAISYRVEGGEIYYTTREHVEKHAPLATVDRRFSEQINRDRRVDFRLP